MITIRPNKVEILVVLPLLLLPHITIISLMGIRELGILGCIAILTTYPLIFIPLFLKDYKTVCLSDSFLEFRNDFLPFLKPDKFLLNNIEEIKIVKYSLQIKLPTRIFIQYSSSKGGILTRMNIKVEDKKDIFFSLLKELQSKNVPVLIEGDFWRSKQ